MSDGFIVMSIIGVGEKICKKKNIFVQTRVC